MLRISLCYHLNIFYCILETKLTTQEVSNTLAGNKEMYSQGNDQSTILQDFQDEKKTLINFSN